MHNFLPTYIVHVLVYIYYIVHVITASHLSTLLSHYRLVCLHIHCVRVRVGHGDVQKEF